MSTTLGAQRPVHTQEFRLRAWLRTPTVAVPGLAGLLAAVITALGSWIPSLWGDEAASALSAQRSLPSFLHEIVHVDAVHAVYYAGLHLWVSVFGASAFALRLPSAIATGVMVAGVVLLARFFVSSWRLPLIAAAFAVGLPRLNFAGIEARSYAWTAAFATWILVCAVATLRGRVSAHVGWAGFALLAGVGTALNPYVGSLILVTGCLAALSAGERRAHLRRWAWASLVALALASPVILLAVLERHQVAFLAHRPEPAETWVVKQWFHDPLMAIIGWALLVAAAVVIAVRRDARLDLGLGVVALLWVVPASAFLIGTIPTLHHYAPRYLTLTAPGVALLMALAVDAIFRSWKPAGVAALVLVLGAAVPAYLAQRGPNAENASDWAEVSQVVAAHALPGDQVAFDTVVRPSRRPQSAWRLYPRDFRNVSVPQLVTPYWQRKTWSDELMTIEDAAAQHRFTAPTVFAVESDFASTGVVDVNGIPALESAGYHVVEHWKLHSDEVYKLDREGTPPR
ncbi:glycosyltransferase family 39 protein [Gryllotalpicola daejeonensis]|uniref:Glycosyltransferase family 39 protein n=1 Tax=Gryllotalpicola daejeonensis TaxID=993087 RepID=A0ABP7ZKV9_9MICO